MFRTKTLFDEKVSPSFCNATRNQRFQAIKHTQEHRVILRFSPKYTITSYVNGATHFLFSI